MLARSGGEGRKSGRVWKNSSKTILARTAEVRELVSTATVLTFHKGIKLMRRTLRTR